ncbi:vinorine synthase-like [Senna tora]|uniref:Vinorine synthase-like n=1 Tax=Senna tora TaxID=362788 RepID=A0A834TMG1_9FABA|nr:vinorine synthase-like [Senna tora]
MSDDLLDQRVGDFIMAGRWNILKLRQVVVASEVDEIVKIPISSHGDIDRCMANPSSKPSCSFSAPLSLWKSIWGSKAVPKANGWAPPSCNVSSPCADVGKVVWVPPLSGTIKFNIDGAFSESSGDAGIGVIARDHEGMILDGCADKCCSSSALMSEALAARKAMELVKGKRVWLRGNWWLLMVPLLSLGFQEMRIWQLTSLPRRPKLGCVLRIGSVYLHLNWQLSWMGMLRRGLVNVLFLFLSPCGFGPVRLGCISIGAILFVGPYTLVEPVLLGLILKEAALPPLESFIDGVPEEGRSDELVEGLTLIVDFIALLLFTTIRDTYHFNLMIISGVNLCNFITQSLVPFLCEVSIPRSVAHCSSLSPLSPFRSLSFITPRLVSPPKACVALARAAPSFSRLPPVPGLRPPSRPPPVRALSLFFPVFRTPACIAKLMGIRQWFSAQDIGAQCSINFFIQPHQELMHSIFLCLLFQFSNLSCCTRGPFPMEKRCRISSHSFLAFSTCDIVDRSVGSMVFRIHDTSIELTAPQSSNSVASLAGSVMDPSMNPCFFLALKAVCTARAHSS